MDYDSRVEVVLKQDQDKKEQQEDSDSGSEISLRELIEVIIKRKKIIIALAAIFIGLTLLYSFITNPNRDYEGVASVILQFNFDGIEKGLDPEGQRFDVGKIHSPALLGRVIENLELEEKGITSSDLRNYFEISPIVPGNIIEMTRRRIEEISLEDAAIYSGEDFAYYPNKFNVSMYLPDDADITRGQGERILRETVEVYTQYFYDTYTDRATLNTAFDLINYEDYDYPEATYIMRKQINIVQNYLQGKKEEHPDFRSRSTGLSFGDIYEGTSVLMDLDITNLNSVIRAYRVSRNTDALIANWQSRIRNYELEMAKLESESRRTRETLDDYEKDKNLIMMGGLEMMPEGIEVEAESPLYDSLVERTLDTGVEAVNLQHEIDYLQEEIDFFLGTESDNDEDGDEDDNGIEQISPEEREEAEEQVIKLIEDTSRKLHNWMILTNQTVDDYIENVYYDRAVMPVTPVQSSGLPVDSMRLNLAIGLVLGLMIGVFWAFFKEYWEKSGKAQTPSGENNKTVSGS